MEREAEERDDVTAAGLHHVMTEYKFVATMFLLCDVLPTVNRLSLLFQAQWIDFSSLLKYIQSAVTKLDGMNTVDGTYLKAIGEYVHELSQSGVEIRKVVKRGNTLDHHEVFWRSVQLPFLTQLVANIDSRFKDGDVIFPLLSVLDPKNLPNAENLQDQAMNPRNPCDDESDDPATTDHASIQGTTVTSLQDYGNESFKTICARFGIEIEPTVEEWDDFRQFFSDHQRNLKLREVTHLLCSNKTQRRLYPRMSKLAQICCVIPLHTTDCERDFCLLNFVKTPLRNHMNERTFDSIIRIVVEGPPIKEFPFTEAVRLWAQRKKRMLKTV